MSSDTAQDVLTRQQNDPTFASVWDELRWRGLVQVSTDETALKKALDGDPITYYCGFDPTAPSLHCGNLLQLLTMRRLQLAGHKPLALVGGSTGLIGDPRPTAERTLNTRETVAEWVARLQGQVSRFLSPDGDNGVRLVNNLDWTSPMSAIDFLRDVGKYFRVNSMLKKDAVAARLNSDAGISYTEFSYQILQGLDYRELFRQYGCTLQTGGSDQWGNLTSGTELIRRAEGATVHALGTPLITNSDGTKFGKSEGNAIWLDAEMTSPYALYQFWLNTADADVIARLREFTFLSRCRDRATRAGGRRRTVPARSAADPRVRGHLARARVRRHPGRDRRCGRAVRQRGPRCAGSGHPAVGDRGAAGVGHHRGRSRRGPGTRRDRAREVPRRSAAGDRPGRRVREQRPSRGRHRTAVGPRPARGVLVLRRGKKTLAGVTLA
ncbi:tyrosine--tRNA ligase [Sphingomonas sp. LR61]